MDYQGLARPANTSYKASYVNGKTSQFGQRMSLSQALQTRKAAAQPRQTTIGGALPFGKSTSSTSTTSWSVGDTALHKKWGEGTVLEVSGSGANLELKINFPRMGLKKLLASVAPITKKD